MPLIDTHGQIDDEIKNYAGADGYGADAMTDVNLSNNFQSAAP